MLLPPAACPQRIRAIDGAPTDPPVSLLGLSLPNFPRLSPDAAQATFDQVIKHGCNGGGGSRLVLGALASSVQILVDQLDEGSAVELAPWVTSVKAYLQERYGPLHVYLVSVEACVGSGACACVGQAGWRAGCLLLARGAATHEHLDGMHAGPRPRPWWGGCRWGGCRLMTSVCLRQAGQHRRFI
jgi:hypothetical protein